MASYLPPIKNSPSGWIGYLSLPSRSSTGKWQSNPTLASGDVKVSLDGGALANLATLPVVSPAGSKLVKVVLSQAETNGDNVTIIFSDAAGDEWNDVTWNLQTSEQKIDTLASEESVLALKTKRLIGREKLFKRRRRHSDRVKVFK